MPRLFLGNFEFEHRLADPVKQLPARLDRLNAELAASWLAVADEGDLVWTPEAIDDNFFEQAAAAGLSRVIPVRSFDDIPHEARSQRIECVPWGWTDSIRQLCVKHGWSRVDPTDAAVRSANSRRLSAQLEQEWDVGLDLASQVDSIEQVERCIIAKGLPSPWVIKAEFGMSGRERLIGRGSLSETDRNWISRRLSQDGVVFFEPWVERLDEIGIQMEIPQAGAPQLVGITRLLVDPRGQYAGSELRWQNDREWDVAVETAMRAADRIQSLGYHGPVGIDAMRYRDSHGETRFRPLQDINARWTMGRLSLGWGRLLRSGETARWLHGTSVATLRESVGVPVAGEPTGADGTPAATRILQTSPATVGGRPTSHASVLVIDGATSQALP